MTTFACPTDRPKGGTDLHPYRDKSSTAGAKRQCLIPGTVKLVGWVNCLWCSACSPSSTQQPWEIHTAVLTLRQIHTTESGEAKKVGLSEGKLPSVGHRAKPGSVLLGFLLYSVGKSTERSVKGSWPTGINLRNSTIILQGRKTKNKNREKTGRSFPIKRDKLKRKFFCIS